MAIITDSSHLTPTQQAIESAKCITPVMQYNERGRACGVEYDAQFDGQYLGTYPTYLRAEQVLNDHVFDLIQHGLIGVTA